jgi:large subunit ribosomal protein L10
MRKEEKNQLIDSLAKQLESSDVFYLTDISTLNSVKTSELRRFCYKKGVKLSVVKNTLLIKAMEKVDKDFEGLYDAVKGSTSVMFSDTGNLPAKMIKEFNKKFNTTKPELKGAYIEETCYVGANQLEFLINIKTKNELIGELIGLLQSPAKNVVSALQSGGNKLAGIVKTLQER